jgi:hypothetical protein
MEGRLVVRAPQSTTESGLERVHPVPGRQPTSRNAVEMEQLFFSGLAVVVGIVQAMGIAATYLFLANTSEKALWPAPPQRPVIVEISR